MDCTIGMIPASNAAGIGSRGNGVIMVVLDEVVVGSGAAVDGGAVVAEAGEVVGSGGTAWSPEHAARASTTAGMSKRVEGLTSFTMSECTGRPVPTRCRRFSRAAAPARRRWRTVPPGRQAGGATSPRT